jgi:hypothetical protein
MTPDPLCTETHEADVTCLECRRLTTARMQGPVKVSAPRHAPLCWCPQHADSAVPTIEGSLS